MKKISITLLFLATLIPTLTKAQDAVSSQVVGKNGVGIPYVYIGVTGKSFGTVSFENGDFRLVIEDQYLSDTLIFAAIGYERKEMSYQEFITSKPDKIYLKEQSIMLEEVTVNPAELTYSKMGIEDKGSRDNYSLNSPLKGLTLSMLFDEVTDSVLISEISVVMGKANMDTFKIRCRIFDVDPVTNLPGDDLMNEELILNGTKKRERLTFIPNRNFWINRPFYIGFEWVSSKKQFEKMQKAKEQYPTDFLQEISAKYPGLNSNINEGKRIHFYDSANQVVAEVPLTKEQAAILREKDKAAPKLQFKIRNKGSKTYLGLPARKRWVKIPHEALISVQVGKKASK